MCNFATVKPIVILLSLLLAAACTTTVPQTSDTEQLMGKREQLAVSETQHIVEPDLAAVIDNVELTPKETFYCIMHYYGKTDQQKAQCFCCTEQALRSTKSRLNKKLDIDQLSHRSTKGQDQVVN